MSLLTYFLTFRDPNIEKQYQIHYSLHAKNKYTIYFYLGFLYGIIYILSSIMEYFYSNISEVNQQSWVLMRVISIIIAWIIFFTIMKIINRDHSCLKKSIDYIIFIFGAILQLIFDNPIYAKQTDPCQVNPGYEFYWESYEIQFYNILVCNLFQTWIFNCGFFTFSSTYFLVIKTSTIHDKLQVIKALGFIIIYTILIYYFEKDDRLRYYELHKSTQKDKMWKDLNDSLPEALLIIDKHSNPSYLNEKMILYLSITSDCSDKNSVIKAETINEFFDQIIQIKPRECHEKFKYYNKKYMDITRKTDQLSVMVVHNEDSPVYFINPSSDNTPFSNEEFTLKTLINFSLNESGFEDVFSQNTSSIFDGKYDGKSIEVRIKQILYEGEFSLLLAFIDTSYKDTIIKLENNDKYKNSVLSTVSHELRTPLSNAINMLQAALEDISIPITPKKNLLKPSISSLTMLTNLINDILDSFQLKANKLNLVFQNIDLRQLIYEASMLFDIQCKKKGLELIIDIPGDIPNNFNTDPNRLTQIILNLMSNAIKFTKQGFIKISIKWENQANNTLIICVEDTGIGISPTNTKNLFTEYGKINIEETSKLNPTGCGLGLCISNQLALRLGSNNSKGIEVESEIKKGSKFYFIIQNKTDNELKNNPFSKSCSITFTKLASIMQMRSQSNLPLENMRMKRMLSQKKICISRENPSLDPSIIDEEAEVNLQKYNHTEFHTENQKYSDNLKSPSYSRLKLDLTKMKSTNDCSHCSCTSHVPLDKKKKIKLLIIDDDAFNLISCESMMSSLGYEYDTANSAEVGFQLLNINSKCKFHKPYDIILIDFCMPFMDGVTATQILKQKALMGELPLIPIIGCTAYNDIEHMEQGIEAGMDGIIVKPLTKLKLVDLIQRFQ